MEFIGLSPAGLNGIPAEDPAKDAAAHRDRRAGDGPGPPRRPAVVDRHPPVRSRTASPRSPRPAARRTASSICWPSPTSSASRSTSTSSARSPTGRRSSRDMRPGGRYTATDMFEAGGVGARHARAAQAAGPAPRRRSRRSTAGRSPRSRRPRSRPPGQKVVRPDRDPAQADRRPGDPARLAGARRLRRQARRPRAAPAPRPGPRLRFRGRLLRRRSRPADQARRRRRHPLRGPGRRPRDAGDAPGHRARSSARASATRSRSSPTAASPAGRTA